MAAEVHAIPVADLRQDDPAGLAPATGAQLATRLAEACADYSLKSHLGLPEVLGRDPTPDEAAIHAAAAEERDAALEAFADWAPKSWEEFADKSEALDRAHAMRCVPPGAGLCALLADARRLGALGLPEAAIPIWIRERERRRPPIDSEDEASDNARFDLLATSADFILRAPCSSAASGAAILRALLDPEIGIFETDISFFTDDLGQHDQPALERVAAFLEQEATADAGPTSRLAPALIEAMQMIEQAVSSDDGEIGLCDPLEERAGELLDGIHLAPCTSRADAAIKLGALQADLDGTADWSAVQATVSASVGSLRSWLLGLPSTMSAEDVITRGQVRQRWAEASARLADEQSRRGPSLAEVALEVGMHHLGRAFTQYRERRPEHRAGQT